MGAGKMEATRAAMDAASRTTAEGVQVLDALDPRARDAFFAFLVPEVVVHEDPKFPEAGVYEGREAVRTYLEQFSEEFEKFQFEFEELIDAGGDDVLMLFRIRGVGKGSGAPFDERPGWLFTVRDGKAVRIALYLDRTEAFEAAGLPAR